MNNITLINGDCLEEMKKMNDNSVDSIVTDPPYGISFMGKKWDYDVPSVEVWQECLRVLKPGGHALVACGTRTQHRMAVNIEDAGFEIRDVVQYLYGSGFPRSLNIGKAVDKKLGNEGEVISETSRGDNAGKQSGIMGKTVPRIDIKSKGNSPYEGWGTALKPACEFWTLARKPLSEKTIANNVLKWGTGGINIDECRVEGINEKDKNNFHQNRKEVKEYDGDKTLYKLGAKKVSSAENPQGRFPANLIHDGSEEVVSGFPESKCGSVKVGIRQGFSNSDIYGNSKGCFTERQSSSGSASRFFYCAKASKAERNMGCEGMENEKFTAGNYSQSPVCKTCDKTLNGTNDHSKCSGEVYYRKMKSKATSNNHPAVKPIKLMQYLTRLITPKNGTILDPYTGSGSTGIGAKLEGFGFIGIEREDDYYRIAEARIKAYKKELKQESLF